MLATTLCRTVRQPSIFCKDMFVILVSTTIGCSHPHRCQSLAVHTKLANARVLVG